MAQQWTPYRVPQSLWAVIELYAPTVELSEIKHIIGEDIIEQSNELFDEIHMLLDIWRTESDETLPIVKADQTLPEPPMARQQMLSQIQYFINNLDETKNHLLKGFLADKQELCNYATRSTSGSRPSSSSDGRMTPSRPNSSRKSSVSTDISTYRDNISAFEIEKVVRNIRSAFEEEQKVLKEDVEFLQNSISEQHDSKHVITREPTLSELKVFANELEKKVMDVSQPVFNDVSSKKPSSPQLKSLPKPPSRTSDKRPSDELFKKLPELGNKPKLSWRQRTLKKVNVPFRGDSSILRDIEIRNNSPSSATTERLVPNLVPKPPPPRTAFGQHS